MTRIITIAGVCSGIGGFDVGFLRANLGLRDVQFRVLWTCERDVFARTVLQARFPEAHHYTDMLSDELLEAPCPDVLMGGTPCQGFSVAGLRRGLNDDRSNLCLRYVTLANALGPRVLLWENVPGVLSMSDNAFGAFLGGLVGSDGALLVPGGASRWDDAGMVAGPQRTVVWRVLDAQYLGVAQRRKRVFLVASPGDVGIASHTGAVRRGRDGVSPLPGAVLLEPEGVRRDTPPRRETWQNLAPTLSARTNGGGGLGTDTELDGGLIPEVSHTLAARPHDPHDDTRATYLPEVFPTLNANHNRKFGSNQWVNNGFAILSFQQNSMDGKGSLGVDEDTEVLRPVTTRPDGQMIALPVAFDTTQITSVGNVSSPKPGDPCHPLSASAHAPAIAFPERMGSTACASTVDLSPTLGAVNPTAVAFQSSQSGIRLSDVHAPLDANNGPRRHNGVVDAAYAVRRLTPRECERLQGFRDDHTQVPVDAKGKPMSDSQRYKQLGNAVCANVAEWIANRLAQFFPV